MARKLNMTIEFIKDMLKSSKKVLKKLILTKIENTVNCNLGIIQYDILHKDEQN